jgi:hypothetical protein
MDDGELMRQNDGYAVLYVPPLAGVLEVDVGRQGGGVISVGVVK